MLTCEITLDKEGFHLIMNGEKTEKVFHHYDEAVMEAQDKLYDILMPNREEMQNKLIVLLGGTVTKGLNHVDGNPR